jgi:hypothetical protein
MDKKIREIDIMVTLLEARLNSLPPEITSKYPDLVHCSIDDVTPEIVISNVANTSNIANTSSNTNFQTNNISTQNKPQEVRQSVPIAEVKVEQPAEEVEQPVPEEVVVQMAPQTPEDVLRAFIEKNGEGIESYYKMLKYGVPGEAVIQKAMFSGYDTDIIKVS